MTKRAVSSLVTSAKGYRDRGQYGQMCGALAVGVCVVGAPFVERVERERVLAAAADDARLDATLAEFSGRLVADRNTAFDHLRERLDTYRALRHLRAAALSGFPGVATALRQRPFKYGKTLFAVANVAFLREYFNFTGARGCNPALASFNTPEDVADAVSAIIALTNEQKPLESLDITFPTSGLELTEELTQLLRYGHAYSVLAETERLISSLGYRLVPVECGALTVFRLLPSEQDVEYALRLGFIRTEIGKVSSELHVARRPGEALLSIMSGMRELIEKSDHLVEIRDPDTRFRRLRLLLPLAPEYYEYISRLRFYEDVLAEERLAQEIERPLQRAGGSPWQLTDHLDLPTFQRAWRALRFWSVMDAALLLKHEGDDTLVGNSLVRVASLESHRALLAAFGLTAEQATSFIKLMHLDVRAPGHVDIQYKPFLVVNESEVRIGTESKKTPREVLHPSSLVAVANIIPNVQRAHGIRVAANAEALVESVAQDLGAVVTRVRTNAAVKRGKKRTDVDIAAFTGDTLYMFECKHSVPPTGAHELRDLWRDIQKGVDQLEAAMDILSGTLADYLAGWFPGTPRIAAEGVKLKPCVLCSHRVFAGLSVRGVPVRDYASFSLTLDKGTVNMGRREEADNTVRLVRYRLRAGDRATLEDLDNYLSPDATFFKMFRPGMKEYTRVDRLTDSVMLARDSFVYQVSDDSWRAALEGIGAVRLEDEILRVGPATPGNPPPEP